MACELLNEKSTQCKRCTLYIAVLRKRAKSYLCRRMIASPIFLLSLLVLFYYLVFVVLFSLGDVRTWKAPNQSATLPRCNRNSTTTVEWAKDYANVGDPLRALYFLSVSLSTGELRSRLRASVGSCMPCLPFIYLPCLPIMRACQTKTFPQTLTQLQSDTEILGRTHHRPAGSHC